MVYTLSVIAPCYNEEGNLRELVVRLEGTLARNNIQGQIVLVNDGSRDATGEVADQLGREYSNVAVVHHRENRGIVGGWKSGVERAEGELVCLIDADLQNLPEDVGRLYQEISTSTADIVQGFRVSLRQQASRFLMSKGLNAILNACFGMHLRDNKSGFIICRREVLGDILRHRFRYYYFQSLIMVSAQSKGYSIREIRTVFENRRAGQSFISSMPVVFVAKVLIDVVKAVYEYRISRHTACICGHSTIDSDVSHP